MSRIVKKIHVVTCAGDKCPLTEFDDEKKMIIRAPDSDDDLRVFSFFILGTFRFSTTTYVPPLRRSLGQRVDYSRSSTDEICFEF